MTVRNPSFIQDLCYTANDDRLTIGGLLCGEGVASFAGLRVTQTLPVANKQVVVSAGHLYVRADNGSAAEEAGYYHFYNDADFAITIPDNGTVSPITYVVWARVCDNQYTSGTSGAALVLSDPNVTTEPGDDCTYYKLATVVASASFVSISGEPTSFGDTDLAITDERTAYTLCGTGDYLRDQITFTSSGSFVKADYPWAKTLRVRAIGGGGAGGGTAILTAGEAACGAGGASGEYSEAVISVADLSASETVTIGAAGAAAAGATGGTGGDTSFGTHVVAKGGLGGSAMGAGSSVASVQGGAGVGGGTGDFTIRGAAGGAASRGGASAVVAGNGGPGPFGGNGRGEHSFSGGGTSGTAAEANSGAGGSGAYRIGTGAAVAGGAGGSGIVIIELHG